MKGTVLGVGLILWAATLVIPVGVAGGCSSSGWGDETCTHLVSCNTDTQVSVWAGVDEPGWVTGSVICKNASTDCSGTQTCQSVSSTTTGGSGSGSCSGSGNGGWWTDLTVDCAGVYAGGSPLLGVELPTRIAKLAATEALGPAVLGLLGAGEQVYPLSPNLEAAMTPSSGAHTWILGSNGSAMGYSCAAGYGCTPVVPTCVVNGNEWACSID